MSTLKEQFEKIEMDYLLNQTVPTSWLYSEYEKLADQHAIGFAEWISCKDYAFDGLAWFDNYENKICEETSELLEIYKKEQELNGLTK